MSLPGARSALALGVTLPIVVIFYLLKVRRHDEEVSSTFLWNDLIRDLAAHEPLQRLKWSLLLLLQLLALALITFAVARPFSRAARPEARPGRPAARRLGQHAGHDVQPIALRQSRRRGARRRWPPCPKTRSRPRSWSPPIPRCWSPRRTDRRQVERRWQSPAVRRRRRHARSAAAGALAGRRSRARGASTCSPTAPSRCRPICPTISGSVDVVPVGQPDTGNLAVTDHLDAARPAATTAASSCSRASRTSPTGRPGASSRSPSTGRPSRSATSTWRANGQSEQVFERAAGRARAGPASPSPTSAATTA